MTSIFVKDLHPNVTESTLYRKFSSIGPLLSLRVCRESGTNRPLGYAYVNFVDQVHANRAIETMNFDLLEGKPIRLMKSERNPLLRKIDQPNIFLKNLDKTITNRELHHLFSQFGNVLSCKVAQDQNGVSKCYGFVQLQDEESAMQSIIHLNGILVGKEILCVMPFIKQKIKGAHSGHNPKKCSTNVYVKNIGKDLNDQGLKEMFEKFGNIVSHKIMTEPDGTSRGFGFVSFENAEAAFNAIVQLNGQKLQSGKALYVGRALTKLERKLAIMTNQEEFKEHQQANLEAITGMDARMVCKKPNIVSVTEKNDSGTKKLSFGERRLLAIREPSSSLLKPDLLGVGVAANFSSNANESYVSGEKKS